MKQKLLELDLEFRKKYSLSIEEYLELLEHFDTFSDIDKETIKLWGEFGNQIIKLPYCAIEFSEIIENEYGSDLDSFLMINIILEEKQITKEMLKDAL